LGLLRASALLAIGHKLALVKARARRGSRTSAIHDRLHPLRRLLRSALGARAVGDEFRGIQDTFDWETPVNGSKLGCKFAWIACIAAGLGLAHPPALFAADPPPEVSQDGLHLQKSTKSTLVYMRPGATWNQYTKVTLLDCFVEFDKNWQRDYNSNQVDPSNRVSESDMNRIKKDLAAEFKKVFTKELQANAGYPVVDTAGPDVLIVRPAIVDLRVTAPDLMTPGINATVVRSAGSATIYVELWDSASNTILARAMDAQADPGFAGRGQAANRVTNTMAADEILKGWATKLRQYLDAAHAKPRD
jgi:hypothetical protein